MTWGGGTFSGQLLGEFETHLVGRRQQATALQGGDVVQLHRRPDRAGDRWMIEVETATGTLAGVLPRTPARWLAPLLDAGWVQVFGYVPFSYASPDPLPAEGAAEIPLILAVVLRDRGRELLAENPAPRNEKEGLHEVVRCAFEEARVLQRADLVLDLWQQFVPLTEQPLLPQTHLLLALIRGFARELQVIQSVDVQSRLHEHVDQLQVDPPLERAGLELFPLCWPQHGQPQYVLLEPALEAALAALEETTGPAGSLTVVNRSDRPLLIVKGQTLSGTTCNWMMPHTVLVAPQGRLELPSGLEQPDRWWYLPRQFSASYSQPPERRTESSWWPLDFPAEAAGLVVMRHGQVVGVELFDAPQTLAAHWDRLSRSCLYLARRKLSKAKPNGQQRVRKFLQHVADCGRPRPQALGLGEELIVDSPAAAGTALLFQNGLCHLSAVAARHG